MKQIIFNVGGALSTYIEFDNKKLLVDIGKSDVFNPITDFLTPLYERRSNDTHSNTGKYCLDQFIISHPHNDHISAISEFNKNLYPKLLTCPNDNHEMKDNEKINWKLFDDNDNIKILKEMLTDRKPPLCATNPTNQFIYYIPPKDVENNKELNTESYCNDISIITYIRVNGTKILLAGDLQKEGMKYIIKNNSSLRNKLAEGVDILVAPHHGLRSSFSKYLFSHIKNKKTRCLNVVSEKPTAKDSDRHVDTRYSSVDYCLGQNNLGSSYDLVYQKKTSTGHIFIDYTTSENPKFEIVKDNTQLINRFL